MPTKQTTTGSNSTAFQFNAQSMQEYLKNLSTTMPWLRNNVTNPFNNDTFNQEQAIGQDQAGRAGQTASSNILNNASALGYGTTGGVFQTMMGNAARNTAGLKGQAFRGAVGNAVNRQMTSAGMLNAFQPLMTGSNSNFTQTQSQSGLGTWLPQVAGLALGAATAGATGGASMIGQGASKINPPMPSPNMNMFGANGPSPFSIGAGVPGYGYGSGTPMLANNVPGVFGGMFPGQAPY